ncbi:hypothetical protein PTKIN_Ptkin11bG0131600 [Pterospermum kingtungense]
MKVNSLIRTYPDIGATAYGHRGRAILSLFLYLELYLVATEFLILEGDNIDKMFPIKEFNIAGQKIRGKKLFVLVASLIVLPTTWLNNLGILAYVSAGGVLISFLLVFCIFWVGAVDGVGFHERGKLLKWKGLSTTISMIAFSYAGHTCFPTLYTSMEDRRRFPKVLLICFIASTINYGSVAVLGYLMYGEHLKSQVTLNLPVEKVSARIAIYTTTIIPLTKYALIMNPIATAIEEKALLRSNRLLSIIIRTLLVISTAIVAITIPFFDYVMAFIGSFLVVTMSIILPCLCYLKINGDTQNLLGKILIIFILVFASFIAVVGTFTSVKQIVTHI